MSAVLKVLKHRFEEQRATKQCTTMVCSVPGNTAVVLDSPHSGRQYPSDFTPACDLKLLQRAQDSLVDVCTVCGAITDPALPAGTLG